MNNEKGVGVIGVVELDFLKIVHNKQGFLKDEQYKHVENTLARKLNDYWNKIQGSNYSGEIMEPDWNWAQCDRCLKWRRLPRGTDPKSIPDKWFCHMNEDQMYNRCTIEEESEHLDTPEESIQTTQISTLKSKRKSKGKKSTRTRSECQSDSRSVPKPQPGRSKYSDEFIDHGSESLSSRETLVRKAAKRHADSIISTEPRLGCSKGPDELVDDGFNNVPAKKLYQRKKMNKSESNISNLNTELEEFRKELPQSSRINATISIPSSKEKDFSWDNYFKETDAKAAPAYCFNQSPTPPANDFSKGMKVEAKDPRNDLSSCIATVINMQGPRLCLRLDYNGDQNDFWRLVDSCDLHPVGFCEKEKNETIQPPVGFQHGCSNWPAFLRETLKGAILAPQHCFKKPPEPPKKNKFQVGHMLEAVNRKHHALIYPATIGNIKEDEIYVMFDGFPGVYNYWCRYDSKDIFPVGWCERSGHPLSNPSGKGTTGEMFHEIQRSTRSNTSQLKVYTTDNETRIASDTEGPTRFHKQVHRLLKLWKPEIDIGEEEDIEIVVDNFIMMHPASS